MMDSCRAAFHLHGGSFGGPFSQRNQTMQFRAALNEETPGRGRRVPLCPVENLRHCLREFVLFPLVVAVLTARPTIADTLRVPSEYSTIQAAVDAASPDDTILVADGLYQEQPTIVTDNLTLLSELPGGAVIEHPAPVVSVTGDSVTVFGFQIKSTTFSFNNAALTLTGNEFIVQSCLLFQGEPCVFVISATGAFRGCTVQDGHHGVEVAGLGSDVSFDSCDFVANSTSTSGGGLLVLDGGSTSLSNCRFLGNSAALSGGAVYAERSPEGDISNVTADRCLFFDNSSGIGAAIRSIEAGVTLRSCTITNNVVEENAGDGAVINVSDNGPKLVTIDRCIIAFNTGPAMDCFPNGLPVVSCSDIFGNEDDGICGIDGGNNINLDPAFCGFENQDFHLQLASPCAPGQSPPGCGLIGAFDPACVEPVSPTTWGDVKYRFRQKGVSR